MSNKHGQKLAGKTAVITGGATGIGRARQFIARASIRASVYLPDPCAPARMTACGKRSRASISRRRWMVSGLPAKSEKGIKNAVGYSLLALS